MSKKPFLSIIIPVFNESRRIHNLNTISNYIKEKKLPFEIIIVNDGSTDDTLRILNKTKTKTNFKIISYKINKGKGYAIKKGVSKSVGKFILFCDIDLSTPIQELDKFMPLTKFHDVLIATRRIKESKFIIHQPPLRESLGRVFTSLSNFSLGLNISDLTCGFKLFSKNSAKEIFPRLRINRWGFDSELLLIAKKREFRIKEVGVNWKNDPLTTVKFPHDIIKSFIELIEIKINDLKGAYD